MTVSLLSRFFRKLGILRQTRIDSSSELFKVGRDEYKYVEGDRSVVVFVELLWGEGTDVRLHSSSIDQWLPPHQNTPITADQRQQIASKIAKFLKEQGKSVEVQ